MIGTRDIGRSAAAGSSRNTLLKGHWGLAGAAGINSMGRTDSGEDQQDGRGVLDDKAARDQSTYLCNSSSSVALDGCSGRYNGIIWIPVVGRSSVRSGGFLVP